MYNDRIEYLKRAIKRTYKRYIGERTDKEATLTDVVKFFNIPIDEFRLDDYSISKIEYKKKICIELVDKKTDSIYTAEYTSCADLLDSIGGGTNYISVTMTNPIKKIESLYYIGDESPIITRMTYSSNGYSLIFEREKSNRIRPLGSGNDMFAIRYMIDNYKESGVGNYLLIKTWQKHDDAVIVYDFEHTFINETISILENFNEEEKYAYIEKDSLRENSVMCGTLIYQRDLGNSYTGVCFESTKISHLEEHFPSNMLYACEKYPKIKDENVLSAIIFRGHVGKENGSSYLEVYKTTNGIIGTYSIKDFTNEDRSKNISIDEEFQLPNLDEGKITSREIKYLLENLQSRFNSGFIELISNDLLEFAKKIDVKNGVLEEEFDSLSPKLLFDKSFEEIADMIESDKDGYFKLASEQFENIAHPKKEKDKVKVLQS